MVAKAAVFDLGNVVVKWDPVGYFDGRIGRARREAFFSAVPILNANERSDAGEDLERVVKELAEQYPSWSPEIRMFWDEWLEMCAPLIDESVALLHRLKAAKVPTFALTNFGAETFEIARRKYPVFELFDKRFVSGRLKVCKPEAGIYAALEEGTGFSGDELVFADDREENIAAAAQRGWQTYLFGDAKGWEQTLVNAGLLE